MVNPVSGGTTVAIASTSRCRCPGAGKVTGGLALHELCVTDLSGLSTYGLNGLARKVSTPDALCKGIDWLTFYLYGQ